jgi:hypothetical protein
MAPTTALDPLGQAPLADAGVTQPKSTGAEGVDRALVEVYALLRTIARRGASGSHGGQSPADSRRGITDDQLGC